SFVKRFGEIDAAARAQAEAEAIKSTADLARPEGLASIDDVRTAKAEQDALMAMTYVPPGEAKIATLAKGIQSAARERKALQNDDGVSLANLQKQVDDLRVKRSNLLRKWDGLWKSGQLNSTKVRAATYDFEAAMAKFKK